MKKFNRTLDELRGQAVLHWPKELLERLSEVSPLHKVLATQEKFLGLLKVADKSPTAWPEVLKHTELPGNIFLKHLMILADLGGEALNKLVPLDRYFADKKMVFHWQGKDYEYDFSGATGKTPLTNGALNVDSASLSKPTDLSPKMQDVAMLILFSGLSNNVAGSFSEEVRAKANIGNLLGKPDEIESFVKQNYVRVSRQMTGVDANALGQITQNYVLEKPREYLGVDWRFERDGNIPGISQTGGTTDTTFDIVAVSPKGTYFAIEVSFQVTTNSVIERKAGQAESRFKALSRRNHYICYVIDGAGNINVRTNATGTICRYSHCTVCFSNDEMAFLADFLSSKA
jgi:hypothetical protein